MLFWSIWPRGIVHEEVLIEALSDHQIAGACPDVFEEEPLPPASQLRELPNVILAPYTAGDPGGVKLHEKQDSFFPAASGRHGAVKCPPTC
uniref:NAD(P)-dependent oxidoreductase n=1 Tax=Dysosmobacter welbionis TaxID=2093857 RepID=UPI0040399ED4